MKCPKCGNDGEIYVQIGMKIHSSLYLEMSKKNIATKKCKIMYAGWPNARFICSKCKHTEKGL